MSRAFSLLVLIGFLILVVTPSLARDLDEDPSLLDLNIDENNEGDDEMLWNIESLKHHRHGHGHRGGRHAPSPKSHDGANHRHHAPPPHRHHHAPPPHNRHHHAPPPAESF
ncbi:uncharacterized protein LOC130993024 [Salvia miltiorrhiza]|uniref:uncharacterized protein LOC130993024 n=1 Tax=Salvia miltiorrhiza TaxID=226208 RepID=UPI0025ABF1EF|nr:uncharacterized protein LOC130993024 [Salvia miltiorrhiza]